jgi:hypothetical protein
MLYSSVRKHTNAFDARKRGRERKRVRGVEKDIRGESKIFIL